ncbi:putative ATP-grasp superfamily ATP-dependent carboligase [Pseudomonas sp. JAI111]|nr:putative ATP-grasp superfamily ATP-dependent carboligase [Pseudomonas sp. JAI111]
MGVGLTGVFFTRLLYLAAMLIKVGKIDWKQCPQVRRYKEHAGRSLI